MRQMISRFFNRPESPVDLRELTRLVRRYSVEQQQVPRELLELVTLNYLPALPTAPDGLRFVIDRKRVAVRLEAAAGLTTQPGTGAKSLEPPAG